MIKAVIVIGIIAVLMFIINPVLLPYQALLEYAMYAKTAVIGFVEQKKPEFYKEAEEIKVEVGDFIKNSHILNWR